MNSSAIIWILIGISFTTYFIISLVYKKLGVHNLHSALLTTNGLRLLNLKHLIGIVLFGILFYTIFPDLSYLVNVIEIPKLFVLITLLFVFFLCALLSNIAVKQYKKNNDPVSPYSFSKAWVYFSIRITFLLCYEFFFRGVLLFKFLAISNLYLSIVYATILYVLIHIFDSKKEIVGAIPFGIVLCLFTYLTCSVWYAFFIHIALSAVYEISIFYYQTIKTSKS